MRCVTQAYCRTDSVGVLCNDLVILLKDSRAAWWLVPNTKTLATRQLLRVKNEVILVSEWSRRMFAYLGMRAVQHHFKQVADVHDCPP